MPSTGNVIVTDGAQEGSGVRQVGKHGAGSFGGQIFGAVLAGCHCDDACAAVAGGDHVVGCVTNKDGGCVAAVPDIAMPAVRRLVERHAAGRERSEGRLYSRLINGERGGYLGYAMWRRYLTLAHG